MSHGRKALTSPISPRQRSSHLADQQIRHLEKVLSTSALVGARPSIQGLDASYWAARANGVSEGYVLLASQKTRVMALARAFEEWAAAAGIPAPAQPSLLVLLAA